MNNSTKNYAYPSEIIIEVTNRCNLRCLFCHFHGQGVVRKRSIGFMEDHIWEKILNEIDLNKIPVNIATHGAGEPLLYPGMKKLLIKASKIPHLTKGFMTNAMLLDENWAKRLVDLQIDWLALSIDGIIPKTHDSFRVNADLKLVEKNVFRLIKEKERNNSRLPLLNFNMVGYPKILDQSEDYVKKWIPYANTIMISKFRPIASRKLWKNDSNVIFRPCPLLYQQMVISYKGDIGLCCEDIWMDVPLGNIEKDSIKDIYNKSPELINYRNLHELGDIKSLKLCRDCHVWGGNILLDTKKITLNGFKIEKTICHAFEQFKKLDN